MEHIENPPSSPALEITTSRQMLAWMAEQHLSLSFTTYQIGKLFFLGLKPNQELSVFERTFNRCMGLCTTDNGLYMSSLYQVWRFENVFAAGEQQDGFDRLYLPQMAYTTGDLDIHDMAVDADGRLLFINTLFGCLATLSETHSFKPPVETPFPQQIGGGRPLPPQRIGHERGPGRLCHRRQRGRCLRRLARAPYQRRHRDRHGQQ